jgi:hypothetical protein
MRSPRSLRFVVGTSLLALGGCTSSSDKIHSNPGPERPERPERTNVNAVENPDSPPHKPTPEEDHVNVGPEKPHVNEGPVETKLDPKLDPDGDGRPNYAINPGPQERDAPPVDTGKKTADPLDQPKSPEPKHVNTGPK